MRSLAALVRRLFQPTRPIRNRLPRPTYRPWLELLESRFLPTVYTVNTVNDILGDTNPGEVTLCDALTAISTQAPSGNAAAGTATNTIDFNIGAVGSVQTINVGSGGTAAGLPAITEQVFMDGWSQGEPGYSGPPLIVLNGTNAGSNASGLTLNVGSDGSTVRGLVIQSFATDGIELNGTSGNLLIGNYIGTDVNGTVAAGNSGDGVLVDLGATANTIGGTDASSTNVISGNNDSGVEISDSGAKENVSVGNLIGTDINGTAKIGNALDGVRIDGGPVGSVIGGTGAGMGNVISGNGGDGVSILSPTTSGTAVQGNFIGTDIHGTANLGNSGDGVLIEGILNTIGGSATGARNVISGNGSGTPGALDGNGVEINAAFGGASANLIVGNFIGTDVHGTGPLGNLNDGVLITFGVSDGISTGAADNAVGGIAAGADNVISGNAVNGVELAGAGTSVNVVLGNRIGTDVNGIAALSNANDGVLIDNGATRNTLGGTSAGALNIISGNGTNGVEIDGVGTSHNVLLGNRIGTDIHGTAKLANADDGVHIDNAASANTIGGSAAGSTNVISGNGNSTAFGVPNIGIAITDSGTSGNVVLGNRIGTNVNGNAKLGNAGAGIVLENGDSANTIGGTAAGAGNVISGNGADGILLQQDGTDAILGNRIGTDVNGTAKLGNAGNGIDMNLVGGVTIGGTASGAGNVISANAASGVSMEAGGTVVLGNMIGTDIHGTANLGNNSGVIMVQGSGFNTVGGTAAGAGNVISGNIIGVVLSDDGTSNNVVLGNRIGTNILGTSKIGNGEGVFIGNGATNNTIGGKVAAAANVVSGNSGDGIDITGDGTSDNVVMGNLIGTNASGTAKISNDGDGVLIADGATGNKIGGVFTAAANLIDGNTGNGVAIGQPFSGQAFTSPGASGNVVQGNRIGTDLHGTANLGNALAGVLIQGSPGQGDSTHNTIGSPGNIIAFNAKGVVVSNGSLNPILGNSIYSNTGIGIDQGTAGVKFPVLTSQTSKTVSGTLTSFPSTVFRLEFFASPATGPAGQGKTFLGFLDVTTNSKGTVAFTAKVATIPAGTVVSATATSLNGHGDTSEFFEKVTKVVITSKPKIAFSTKAQVVTFAADVLIGTSPVPVGKVTFTIKGVSGSATGTVSSKGIVTVKFTIPAKTPKGSHTITAQYDGEGLFAVSDGTGVLTIT